MDIYTKLKTLDFIVIGLSLFTVVAVFAVLFAIVLGIGAYAQNPLKEVAYSDFLELVNKDAVPKDRGVRNVERPDAAETAAVPASDPHLSAADSDVSGKGVVT